nr:hypothetical protein GCM10020093_024330 [Planobispora longispora]
MVAVLGPNGAGKTTMLRALSGLVRGRGSVLLDGTELLGRAPEEIVRLGVAHVPEGRGLFAPSPWRRTCGSARTCGPPMNGPRTCAASWPGSRSCGRT